MTETGPIRLEPLPYEDGARYFSRIRHLRWPIWLDSNPTGNSAHSRFDILSADPASRITLNQEGRCIAANDTNEHEYTDLWSALDALVPIEHRPGTPSSLPFYGGAMGYIGYDAGARELGLPIHSDQDLHVPLAQLGIYLWAVILDHHQQQAFLMCRDSISHDQRQQLRQMLLAETIAPPASFSCTPFQSDMPFEAYQTRFERIKAFIEAGDCYQINFAQRFRSRYEGDCLSAYLALRQSLPSPFSCYMETESATLMSLSPERFIACRDQQVITQPIKGTIRRGDTPEEDAQLAQELRNSPKDQAENLMIVDLLRNDLSKVCIPFSVQTPKLFALESFTNVHHLVSTVTGQLSRNVSAVQLLQACFPGGSITGAPKIRAMEIIESLEKQRRSLYCGSVAYFSFDGQMDSSITIRTAIADKGSTLCVWGGGGIVADSELEEEYNESCTKVRLILETLQSL